MPRRNKIMIAIKFKKIKLGIMVDQLVENVASCCQVDKIEIRRAKVRMGWLSV
jgi:hypothetical protein